MLPLHFLIYAVCLLSFLHFISYELLIFIINKYLYEYEGFFFASARVYNTVRHR